MGPAEIVFYGFWIVAGLAMALIYWPRSGLALYHHRYALWQASCRQRGLLQKEMQEEFLFRNGMASLRRNASEATLASPDYCRRFIAGFAAEQAKVLAIHDELLAKRFLRVVNTSRLSDILYPDALAAAVGRYDGAHARITQDNLAALKTL